jgi:holin-like protein
VLSYITLLLVCQLVGEAIVRLAGLPVPGPVVGMLVLFAGLVIRGRSPEGLDRTAQTILGNLSLLFIPASVGVMVHLHTIARDWLPISVAIIASTVLTIAVTGLAMQRLTRARGKDGR